MIEQEADWYVDVVRAATGEIEKSLGPYGSERTAERAEDGLNRNIDHERYYTDIREEER